MYAPTAAGATAARPDRASAKISRIRPAVATTSPSHRCPASRRVCDQVTGSRLNIRFARIDPPIAPRTCAATYPPRSLAVMPVRARRTRNQSAADTTGLRCAPDTRAEDQNQGAQGERGRGGVLQQLQPDVVRGQLRGHDPGADDGGDEKRGAGELGEQPTRQDGNGGHQHSRRVSAVAAARSASSPAPRFSSPPSSAPGSWPRSCPRTTSGCKLLENSTATAFALGTLILIFGPVSGG